jgi:hypothetical protein
MMCSSTPGSRPGRHDGKFVEYVLLVKSNNFTRFVLACPKCLQEGFLETSLDVNGKHYRQSNDAIPLTTKESETLRKTRLTDPWLLW